MALGRMLRLAGAAFLVIGGLVHYDLWSGGYRGIPSIGPLFLVNVVASAVVAAVLVLSGRPPALVAAALVALGSLAALVASRTVGFLGFMETWTDPAIQVLAAEVGTLVAVAAVAVTDLSRRRHAGRIA